MNKNVLVTGAGGFIGVNLINALLKRGDEVHVLRRPNNKQTRLTGVKKKIKSHTIDISNDADVLKLVRKIKPKQVFHLAHYGGNPKENDSIELRKVIIDGTRAIFNACAQVESIKAVVHTGSSSEYGTKLFPMREDMLLEPSIPYGCAKAWATLYGQHLAREKNVPIVTLRLFSVFGPWEMGTRFIPAAILACLNEAVFKLSNPKTVRDFVFVEDVVRAILMAAKNTCTGEVINIGSGRQTSLKKTADLIFKNTEKKPSHVKMGSSGRSFDRANVVWKANISKAKKLLNWQPKFSLEEGITQTIKWINENEKFYKTI